VVKMQKIVTAQFLLRGTEKEIETVKARIAALSAYEEVVSMFLREAKIEE